MGTFQLVKVPEGVEASVKSRTVTVKGARGTLTKAFKHLAVDIYMVDKDTIKVEKWFGKKKQLASVRTVCSHIENLFKGVMKGFLYKMRAVYAHFPISCAITEGGTLIDEELPGREVHQTCPDARRRHGRELLGPEGRADRAGQLH